MGNFLLIILILSLIFRAKFSFGEYYDESEKSEQLDDSEEENYHLRMLEKLDYTMEETKKEISEMIKRIHSEEHYNYDNHNYVKFDRNTEKIGMYSKINLLVYKKMRSRNDFKDEHILKELRNNKHSMCTHESIDCDQYNKYRSIDGTCNNLEHHYWGSTYTELDRILDSDYEDGFNEPRGGGFESKLPNCRHVSSEVHKDRVATEKKITVCVMQFGQFLDHDMSMTPESDLSCCDGKDIEDPDCYPIQINKTDKFYSKLKHPQTCMDFTRSSPYCYPTKSGKREQFNVNTDFLDLSQIYGCDKEMAEQLRAGNWGLLRANRDNPEFLPTVEEVSKVYGKTINFKGTYLSGDARCNEMPGLTVFHILFYREHNRLAKQIYELYPEWSDEKIFQEARRINIAIYQNVAYSEYLPAVLGEKTMKKYGLQLGEFYEYSEYDEYCPPVIYNEFATAAYRFGHSLIPTENELKYGQMDVGRYKLRDNFFNSEQITRNNGKGYDYIFGGLITQPAQKCDPFISKDMRDFLLKEKEKDYGSDIASRNCARGREHGIPGYNAYREYFGMEPMSGWDQKPSEMNSEVWKKLPNMYEKTDHIDLFTGGISEKAVCGGLTGHVFNGIKAMQFKRLKDGDRFFFTHKGQSGSFYKKQLMLIIKVRFSDIICQNSKLHSTPQNVFKAISAENHWEECADRENYIDLKEFYELKDSNSDEEEEYYPNYEYRMKSGKKNNPFYSKNEK